VENNKIDIDLHERMARAEAKIEAGCKKIDEGVERCDSCRIKKIVDWTVRIILLGVIAAILALVIRR
jgi:t-SNARE complex subunit (syntaxin)